MKRNWHGIVAAMMICIGLAASDAHAQMAFRRLKQINMNNPGAGGVVTLPYQQADSTGNMWMIYDGGWLRQNGNNPIYSQGAMLTVNGVAPQQNNNQALVDAKTGELIMDNMQCGNMTVTRRMLINKDEGYVRYIDILKNTQGQDQTVNLGIQSNLNYGVNSSTIVTDPKHKENQIGWVAMTGINRAAVEMFAGKGAKVVPTITYQQGNNMVQANLNLTVPAGKSVAVMHLHMTAATADAGQQFILGLKENKMIQGIPADIRKLLANFTSGMSYVGDMEILRGDIFDVVELRTGDQMKGTLKEDSYKLATFYGNVELPKDQVIGIINVGQFRPRQLLVTADGQIFGGRMDKETITLELSSGQVTQVPLSQITRVGYRKRAGEPEDWTFDKPFVLMRTGDRVNVEMPTTPVEVTTRYGLLKLDPQSVAAIAFQSEDNGVHEVFLTDGSKFAGLANATEFEMKLTSGVSAQPVKFPASSILKLQLAGKIDEADDATPTVALVNEDLLVGSLTGDLKLDTAFDTLQVKAEEIRKIAHSAPGSADVQVTLWDNTTVSGQLEEPNVHCKLTSGATMDVPLALLAEYNQPMPQPSASMVEKIKQSVTNLSADDWKQRDQAEGDLVKMGAPVIGVLKALRPTQPPEAQQRIDSIVKQLEKQGAPVPKAAVAAPMQMEDVIMK